MPKHSRPVPRVPKGFRDIDSETLRLRKEAVANVTAVFDSWGFEPLETPAMEYVDCLGKFLPESDAPQGGIYALRDEDDEWIALRYDLTAPLARYVAANFQNLPKPFRRYQVGHVWRVEKPGPGRFREFVQVDLDTVAAPDPVADAEVVMILCEAMEAIGMQRQDYVVRMSDRRIINGLLALGGIANPSQMITTMRAIDKLDRIGLDGVAALLYKGRRDESGDFTPGAGLDLNQINRIIQFLSLEIGEMTRSDVAIRMMDLVGSTKDGKQGALALKQMDTLLAAAGYDDNRAIIDPTVVRGLAYYTGPVFEVNLTFDVTGDDGLPRVFGSVAGGGRYDELVERFIGQKVPATGASIGVDRLLAAWKARGKSKAATSELVVVTVMEQSRLADYFTMASELRAAGFRAEVFTGSGGFAKQVRYADARGAACAVIAGSDEFDKGRVSIKDLRLGEHLSAEIAERDKWLADRPAQVTVAREKMVEEINSIVKRYRVEKAL